jgi:opacity protein-like surface antigen
MRKAILGAASALALASPAVAADLQVTPYSENPGYEQEVPPYAYGTAPPYAYGVARPYAPYAYGAAPPVVRFGVADGDGAIGFRGGWGWGHRGHFRGGW